MFGLAKHRVRKVKTPKGNYLVETMADERCSAKGRNLEILAGQSAQRRVLYIVLAINAVMFVLEFGAGMLAGSTA